MLLPSAAQQGPSCLEVPSVNLLDVAVSESKKLRRHLPALAEWHSYMVHLRRVGKAGRDQKTVVVQKASK